MTRHAMQTRSEVQVQGVPFLLCMQNNIDQEAMRRTKESVMKNREFKGSYVYKYCNRYIRLIVDTVRGYECISCTSYILMLLREKIGKHVNCAIQLKHKWR